MIRYRMSACVVIYSNMVILDYQVLKVVHILKCMSFFCNYITVCIFVVT